MNKLQTIDTNENFKLMEERIHYIMNINELTHDIHNELKGIEQDGYYCVLDEDSFNTIPFGERWYVKYYPTYHMSVLLVQYYVNGHKEIYDDMMKTLNECVNRKYLGHSYDNHSIALNYLIKLYKAGIASFMYDSELGKQIDDIVRYYRERLANNQTSEGFGNLEKQIKELLSLVDNNLLFVYGTLMRDEISHHMLEDALYLGDCFINGYGLVEVDGYPGMIDSDSYVAGEVYKINNSIKHKLDIYEDDEYTYESEYITLDGLAYHVHFYKYILEENRKYSLSYTRDGRWLDVRNYVWYASYGSNVLDIRMNKYIDKTSSRLPFVYQRNIIINHPIYFALRSRKWNNMGICFLDTSKQGMSFGRMYLITKDQFNEIMQQEGPAYNLAYKLSQDELGVDIMTITSSTHYDDTVPSIEYLEVIGAGIKQAYHLETNDIINYLGHYNELDLSSEHINTILLDK